MLIPYLKYKILNEKLIDKNKFKLKYFLFSTYYFVYTLSNILVMFIMMSMNGWVNISVAIGLTIGFFL